MRFDALAHVVHEVWTDAHCQQHYGAIIRLSDDLRGPCITVGDDQAHTTVKSLDVSLTSAQDAIGYIEQQIIAAVREHKQPYGRYPATTALDELDYLSCTGPKPEPSPPSPNMGTSDSTSS